jgi:O-acetyl-ADP-ribose deacetylase
VDALGAKSIAFCSLSTGAFGYPLALAAPIALGALSDASRELKSIESVTIALYGEEEYRVFCEAKLDSLDQATS